MSEESKRLLLENNQDVLLQISHKILEWFAKHGQHDLPWRKENLTPYHIWVSEVMLQQTQVNRVVTYYERFIERYPNAESLAATTWEEFLPYYQGLGYYARGRNMLKTAKILVEQYNGTFPATRAELEKLPGIGEYTASAILSFGMNQPFLAFDTNHQRVWGRILYGNKKAPIDAASIEFSLQGKVNFRQLNAAIMDYARLVCTNQNSRCATADCPVVEFCQFSQTHGTLEVTPPRAPRQSKPIPTTLLVLHENHKKYFSSQPITERYQPFILPHPIVSRAQIKEYFSRNFDLNLSVRPPQWTGEIEAIGPAQIVHAQILSGACEFAEYGREEYLHWKRSNL